MAELVVKKDGFAGGQEDYDAIEEAVKKLFSASEEQFETIKKEKWYNRVFDMVTFSQKGKKRLAEQIGTLAQAQQVFVEMLDRVYSNDENISRIVYESMEYIRRLQDNDSYLLERIKRLEKIALGVKPDMDINLLSEQAKGVLSGCLYRISGEYEKTSNEQKEYANSVLSYIGKRTQMDHPEKAFDKLDAESRKRILTCCMEYMFLHDCSSNSYSDFHDFIGEFDFGKKTMDAIEEQIDSTYRLMGVEGLCSKYAAENFAEVDDYFSVDFLEEDFECEEEIELTDETITSILEVKQGETKSFKNKNIHISAYINCKGNIDIDNCVLYYNETDAGDEITLQEGGCLSIRNSYVVCKGFDKKPFISCTGNNTVVFEMTTFCDCSCFFEAACDKLSFVMNKCELINCWWGFVDIHGEDSSTNISSCKITQNGLSDFNTFKNDSSADIETIRIPSAVKTDLFTFDTFGKGSSTTLFDSVFIETDTFKEEVHSKKTIRMGCISALSGIVNIENCSFMGIVGEIEASNFRECIFKDCRKAVRFNSLFNPKSSFTVDNCLFENCLYAIRGAQRASITNCQFINCVGTLLETSDNGGVSIEFCEFKNIRLNLLDAEDGISKKPDLSIIEDCFSGMDAWDMLSAFTDEKGIIVLQRSKDKNSECNYLKNCIFEDVECDNGFLVMAKCKSKPSGIVSRIENCDFRNCSTKRSSGKIVKEYIQYDALLKKNQDFLANIVVDCKGLDKVNKEVQRTTSMETKKMSTTGTIIGSSIGNIAMPIIGGPIGLAITVGKVVNASKKLSAPKR